MRTRAVVLGLSICGVLAAPAGATSVVIGPTPLSTDGASYYYCEPTSGGACTSASFAHLTGPGGELLSGPRGKIVSWRVMGSKLGTGTHRMWVVRPSGGSTMAVAGPTEVPASLAGDANPISPPLPFESGDGIALALITAASLDSSAMRYYAGSAAREFKPGFSALNTPLTGIERPYNVQFNAELVLAPVLTESNPPTGSSTGGTTVKLTGSALDGATGVSFGATPATSFTVDSPTSITAVAPVGTPDATVPITVTGTGGTSTPTAGARFTYIAPPPTTATPTTTTPPPPPPADSTAPALSKLRISPASFVAGNTGPSLVRIAKVVGGKVTFSVSEPARTTFTVKRKLPGLRSGKSCVAPTTKLRKRKARKCDRLKSVAGSFTSDATSFRFMARLNGKALTPGRYVLNALPTDAAGNRGKAASAAFTILKP